MQYYIYVPLFSRLFPNAASFAAKSITQKLADPKGIRDLFAQATSLPISPISPISPHISAYLPISPHISARPVADASGISPEDKVRP